MRTTIRITKLTAISTTKPATPSTTTITSTKLTTTTSTTTMALTEKNPCENLQAIQTLDLYKKKSCHDFPYGLPKKIWLKHRQSYICSVTLGK